MLGLFLRGVMCSQVLLKSFGIVFFIVLKRIKSRLSWAGCFFKTTRKISYESTHEGQKYIWFFLCPDLQERVLQCFSCLFLSFFNSPGVSCLLLLASVLCGYFVPSHFPLLLFHIIQFGVIFTLLFVSFLLHCKALGIQRQTASMTLLVRSSNHLHRFPFFWWFSSICENLRRMLALWDLSCI